MPYIVTTNVGCDDADCNPNCRNRERSRRAVATPEEAWSAIRHAIDTAREDMRGWADEIDAWANARAFLGISIESGGTVGPLPDGTVIEVGRVEWIALAHALPMEPWPGYDPENASWRRKTIDAYNARQS